MFGGGRFARRIAASVAALLFAAVVGAQSRTAPKTLLATTRHSPDEFGTQDYTVTTISAVAFTADDASNSWGTTLCCLSRFFYGGAGHFYANVDTPTGVVIDFIGLQSYSSCEGIVGVELRQQYQDGSTGGIAAFSSTAHGYGTDYNASPLGLQVTQTAHNGLVVHVELSNACANYPAFQWVEIWWRRVVSPPPGSPSFNDVPVSDSGFQYVEALAASGITAGCGGGNFCPDSPLTRRQMAVFLSKALGLHCPY